MEVTVPDIGDFTDVPVIEVLVGPGDEVAAEDPLVVLESDKATMEVPVAGRGQDRGDRDQGRRQGLRGLGADDAGDLDGAAPPSEPAAPAEPAAAPSDADVSVQVAVLGGGPGGYTAAFRAADLGLSRRADRPRRDARRRVPERRLHPVQGAAAHRQGADRGARARRVRHLVRRAVGRRRQGPRVEEQRRRAVDRRPRVAGQAAQGAGRARRRARSPARTRSRSATPSSASSTASSPPARRPRRCRSCPTTRGSWTPRARWRSRASPSGCWSSAAGSSGSRWRRSTTRSAPRHGRRAARPAHPGRRQGPDPRAREAREGPLRGDPPLDRRRVRRGQGRRAWSSSSATRPRPSTGSSSPWGASPTAA